MSLGRILVVEDDQQIADVVEHLLKSNDYEVRTAADGQAALRQFKSYRPDLVFLDLNLPRLSGWEVLRQIRQERSDIPVIMLTSQTEEADRVLGLERGADDYITKPFNNRELVARVGAVLRRCRNHSGASRMRDEGPVHMEFDSGIFTYFGRRVDLTRQEFELMQALVESPARTYARDELIGRMYNEEHPVTDRSVDACVKRIRKKLQAIRADVDPISTSYGRGYKLNEALGSLS